MLECVVMMNWFSADFSATSSSKAFRARGWMSFSGSSRMNTFFLRECQVDNQAENVDRPPRPLLEEVCSRCSEPCRRHAYPAGQYVVVTLNPSISSHALIYNSCAGMNSGFASLSILPYRFPKLGGTLFT